MTDFYLKVVRPDVFRLEKTWKIGKNIKNALVLVWGSRFWKIRAKQWYYRKNSGNSQRLSVVNVINLKHDQLETEAYMLLLRPSRFRGRTRELLSLATFSCRGRESWNAGLTNTWSLLVRPVINVSLLAKCSYRGLRRQKGGRKEGLNYRYRPTSAGEKSNAPWDGLVDLWRCGRIHCLHLVWLASCKT